MPSDYSMDIAFRETTAFSKAADRLFSSEELRALQLRLLLDPAAGRLMPGTGGLRKLRWVWRHKGKRGGVRVVYFWVVSRHRIYLLAAYPKSERDDLTVAESRALRALVAADDRE